MIKNKKLISLVAAIAMMFTMLSSFTFANAVTSDEISQGITLSCDEAADGLSVTLTVGYKGITDGVETAGIQINGLPSQTESVEATTALAATESLTPNIASGNFIYANSAVNNAEENGTIRAFKITFSEPLTKDATLTLANTSYSYLTNASAAYSTLDNAAEAGMTKIEAVTEKVTAVNAPKTADVDQPEVNTDPAPEPLPEIKDIAQGLTLDVTKNSDTEYTITVGYVGITDGVETAGIQIDGIPTDAVSFEATTALAATESLTPNIASGNVIYANSAVNNTEEDGTIRSFKLTLAKTLSEDIQISLAKNSYSYLTNASAAYSTLDNAAEAGMTKIEAANANLEAAKKTGGKTVAIPVNANKVTGETVSTDGKKTSDYYIVAKVVDGSDNEVAYGQDEDGNDTYVAQLVYTDADGVEQKVTLTKGQYENLMGGHLAADNVKTIAEAAGIEGMADVIEKVQYVMYNSALKVNAQLVQNTVDGNLVKDEGTGTQGPATPTQPPKTPSIEVKGAVTGSTKDVKKVEVGKVITLTASTSNLKPEQEGGTYTFAFKDATQTKLDELSVNAETGVAKYEALKTGTATVVVKYVKNDEVIASTDVEITVTAAVTPTSTPSSSSSGGSSSGNGGGPIAGPSGSLTATGGTTIGGTSFNDLGDVVWAQEAIYTLAAAGIINGRDEYTFDPNANITRAEYCQILIGAIGKTTEYADSSFADVPTDAWFYHAVAVASQYGIVSGYGDGNFGPYDLITRQDMALMTYRAAQVMDKNLAAATESSFADAEQISDYAQEAVYTLANAGIINGMGDGTFAPIANATRAQAAVIIYTTFVK